MANHKGITMDNYREFLLSLFESAVSAATPSKRIKQFLPSPPKGKTIVIGAGKAAASMAKAVEENWEGSLSGLVVTRYGHSLPCEKIKVIEASHPVPDDKGEKATKQMLSMVKELGKDDLVICLISGGGSALLTAPADGIDMNDKRTITKALLKSGADIAEMNCVRKHLSAVKGGRLALAAYPARIVSLLISDVVGDNPSVIASGPTVPDPTTCKDAINILEKYNIPVKEKILELLRSGELESPKPENSKLEKSEIKLVSTPHEALLAAAETARKHGVTPIILGDAIEGEAKEVAKVMAGITASVMRWKEPVKPPCVILSGGETTVTVKGNGRGGRNAEFLLGLGVALNTSVEKIWAIACDTDGIDGTEDNAGAVLTPDSFVKARELGINPETFLADNNAYVFFESLGDLIKTGPTRTNVNDFRAIYIEK
ncbi:MAG: glycerate kinase [Alphaproteobacteria bacterium]|nr:glycerate kinase [Alphaproteobacteria bacterium]